MWQVNTGESAVVLRSDTKEEHWKPGESLVRKLEAMGIVKEVFPLHGTIISYVFIVVRKHFRYCKQLLSMFFLDEKKRKQLLRSWAMNWSDVTQQPIDDICAYYGMKVNANSQ